MQKMKRELTDEEKQAIAKAKKELQDYCADVKYIDKKLEDIEEVRARTMKTTASWSKAKVQNGVAEDRFAEAMAKIEELGIECTERLQKTLMSKFRIDEKIDSMEIPYRDVLFYRYTRGMSWRDVANEVQYTEDYTRKELHGQALYYYSKI